MYLSLLVIHSSFRWIALVILVYSVYRAFSGYISNGNFLAHDNAIRHWTATVLQVQMVFGIILYFKSPFVAAYSDGNDTDQFFAIIHPLLMLIAVIIVSIGSAMAKRKLTDKQKYKTMLIWFMTGLVIILMAIPWPFSAWMQRPYFRIS